MRIIASVARRTGSGRANKEFILMALSAGYCGVLARQLEDGIIVIEGGGRPAVGGVAFRTLCAEFALVRIGITMAGGAVHGRALEDSIDVTARAGYGLMFTGQLEGRIVVIERGWLPAAG